MPDHGRDPSAPTRSGHAGLTPRRWWALDDVLAEMCERTDGTLEDLHDRGRGILETCRPGSSEPPPDDATGLRRHIHQVIGALAHLDDAAPEDSRAVRATGRDVARLARRMLAHPRPGSHPARPDHTSEESA